MDMVEIACGCPEIKNKQYKKLENSMTNINENNSPYNLVDYIDLFVEEGYPLLQEGLAAADAETPDEPQKAALAESIGADAWGFFGCAGCLIVLGALLETKDQAIYDEIRAVNLQAAVEIYPDIEDAVADFYEFLYENEDKSAAQDEELLMEYLTFWLANCFFEKETGEEFTEGELDVAYVAVGAYGDFLKQVLMIQQDTFEPYIKDSVRDVSLSGLLNLDDSDPAVN